MDLAEWIALATLIVVVVGVALVIVQLGEQKRATRAVFGTAYVQRYWQIDDDRQLLEADDPRRPLHERRYLQLLEDESDVAALGLLDLPQWAGWHGVLDEEPPRTRVADALQVCDPGTIGFPRLRRCLDQRQRDGARHDISRCAGA